LLHKSLIISKLKDSDREDFKAEIRSIIDYIINNQDLNAEVT